MPGKLPNIVLTIADDQRGAALGCAGVEPVLTPCLDALAARGVRFAQAQHFGSCHGAICAPSRAMLMTGIPYFRLDPSLLAWGPETPSAGQPPAIPPTLGQKLRGAGYTAFATGKWHNGARAFAASFDAGANIFFGGMADHWFTPVHDFDPAGLYPKEAARLADGFSTEVFAQSAVDFIRSRRDNAQPFFCYCAFTAPHDPRTPPDEWRRKYDPMRLPLPPNIVPRFYDDSPAPLGMKPAFDLGGRDELLLGIPRDVNEIKRSLAEYYGMTSHMDEHIGRIHAALEEIGQLENTIVIHTADHGLAVGQHGLMGKQNLYQHSVNVPLLAAGPGLPRGLVSDALCYQHDLHPTLAEVAGVGGDSAPFQSLRPLWEKTSTGRSHVGCAYETLERCARDGRYKLIEYRIKGASRSELFDLQEDPWETRDLSGDASHAKIMEALRRELAQWQKDAGDTDWPAAFHR
jgi:arylsulfatase A-like enzyme